MSDKNKLAFGKMNYMIMIGGLVLLFLGYWVMTLDNTDYGMGTVGLTIGPLMVIGGFIVEFFAIMYRPRSKKD